MCGTCKLISALLIALVGLVFLLSGLGMVANAMLANLIVGVLLLVFGLSGVVHALKMCPSCKNECCQTQPPAKKGK